MIAGALQAEDDATRAGALVVQGEIMRRRGDLGLATDVLEAGLQVAITVGDQRLAGEALRQLGLLDYFDGRLRAAEQRFGDAHALSRRIGDRRGAGWALQHLAWSATTRGDYALADSTLREAAEVFGALEDAGGLSWVAGTEGFVRLLQGRLAQARALAGSVLPRPARAQDPWGVAALLTIDAYAAAELGAVSYARAEAARARVRFATMADTWGESFALIAAGVAARGDDEPDTAVALLSRAVVLSAPHPLTASIALVSLGYAHLDRGDLDGAGQAAERATILHSTLDLEPHAPLGAMVLRAQVLRRNGDLTAALAQLDAALDVATAPALLFPRRQALAYRAGTLRELGRFQEALATAREAMAMPGEDVRSRVLALRAYGAALLSCGQRSAARAALLEALEVSRSTGQRSEIRPTERVLATLS